MHLVCYITSFVGNITMETAKKGTLNTFDLQALIDAIPFYVMLVDEKHEILMTNRAIQRDLGLNPQQVIGGFCPKVVHGLDEPYPGCPLEEALEKGHDVEREFFNAETERWVSSAIYSTGRKNPEGREIFIHFILDISERKRAEEELRKNHDIQSVINDILRLSLEDIPIEKLLEQILGFIFSIPQLAIESKGSIFLVENEEGILIMKSQSGLSKQIQKECARIPFGKCLCGQAAQMQEIQFAEKIDGRHEIQHGEMAPHGHYCVPISSPEKVLGVINLYLKEGHVFNKREEEFLTTIANSLAGIIKRKQIDQALKEREKELEQKTLNLEEMNSALKILLERREEDRKELEEKVLFNVKGLVVQYIERLRGSGLDKRQLGYLDVLESNLNSIISPFSRKMSSKYLNLTPVEVQVADLIRQGKTTKEIAVIFNLSTRTIEFHRQNIRKKLGLKEKKANLRTSLLALQ